MANTKKTKVPVESLVGKKYQRTGKDVVVTVVSHDIDRCSAIIEFPDGKTTTLTTTTLKDKRKWVEVVESSLDVTPIPSPSTQQIVSPEPEITHPVVDKPISQPQVPKKRTQKVSTSNVQNTPILDFVLGYVSELGLEIFVPANGMKMRSLKCSGHMCCKFNWGKNTLTLSCRSIAVQECNIQPTKIVNHMFDNNFVFTELNGTTQTAIKALIKASMDYQVHKNNNSKKEKEN